MWSSLVQGNSDGPLVPMVRLVLIENDVIPMALLVKNKFAFRSRPRPHVSRNLWKRKFFFTNTPCVHTYPAYFPAVCGNFLKRSPEWKFFYPIRIRIRVDGRIRKFANTLTSFSWIQSSRRAFTNMAYSKVVSSFLIALISSLISCVCLLYTSPSPRDA